MTGRPTPGCGSPLGPEGMSLPGEWVQFDPIRCGGKRVHLASAVDLVGG